MNIQVWNGQLHTYLIAGDPASPWFKCRIDDERMLNVLQNGQYSIDIICSTYPLDAEQITAIRTGTRYCNVYPDFSSL